MAWPSGKAEACKASIPSSNLGATLSFLISPMLYVVATPIGNLSDITFRALETMKSCDYLLCEDTRHSGILLHHYEIRKPLKSFHKFSESAKQQEILDDLKQGVKIALISDAGTPGIADPGENLIKECVKQEIPVVVIPGPCAVIAALCCSGLSTERFQFVGFLPRKTGELRRCLQELLTYPGTTICYESPNRLSDVLEVLNELASDRQLVVARELTKKFEEVKRGVASELLSYWSEHVLKGEIVLLISAAEKQESREWESLTPQEHVDFIQSTYGVSRQEAILHAAKIRGVSKREVYNAVHRGDE